MGLNSIGLDYVGGRGQFQYFSSWIVLENSPKFNLRSFPKSF